MAEARQARMRAVRSIVRNTAATLAALPEAGLEAALEGEAAALRRRLAGRASAGAAPAPVAPAPVAPVLTATKKEEGEEEEAAALQEAGRESAGAAPVVPAPVAPSSYTATQTETKKEASEEGGDAAAVQEAGRAAPVAPVAPAPEQPEEVVSQPEVSGERGPVASRQCPARCPECEDENVVSYCCAPIIAGAPHDHQCPLHHGWRPGAGAHRR